MKQQQLNYSSQNNSVHLALVMMILIWHDPSKKSTIYLLVSDFNLKAIYSKLFLKDQRLYMEPFLIGLVVIRLKKLSMKCVDDWFVDGLFLFYFF
jgi:hypothetical protein